MSSDDSTIDTNDSYESGEIIEVDEEIPKDFNPITFFTSQKQLCYFKMIDKYFKKCPLEMRQKMVDIINSTSIISLRVLEWVVTKSGTRALNIRLTDNDYYSVNIMYKAQLKSYKKKNFDPFRRDKKFWYTYDKSEDNKVLTTLGQLNFFKWAISNKIIEYVEKHYSEINLAMIAYNKDEKIKKIEKKKKKLKIIAQSKKINNDNKSSDSSSTLTSKSTKSSLFLDTTRFTISFD